MGVDFNNGGMSYPRYDNFVTSVAQFYNGNPNIYLPENRQNVFLPFGFIEVNNNAQIKEKFYFNENTPNIIRKWCNNPYGDLSKDDVNDLYNILNDKKNEIQMFDDYTLNQFLNELKYCIEENEDWYIG